MLSEVEDGAKEDVQCQEWEGVMSLAGFSPWSGIAWHGEHIQKQRVREFPKKCLLSFLHIIEDMAWQAAWNWHPDFLSKEILSPNFPG